MATALKDSLLDLIGGLRAAGVRISVAESLDAMRAAAVSGLERTPLREALRATLIKDEADNAAFDEIFARHFGIGSRPPGEQRQSRGARIGVSGGGHGDGGGSPIAKPDAQPAEARPGPPRKHQSSPDNPESRDDSKSREAREQAASGDDDAKRGERGAASERSANRAGGGQDNRPEQAAAPSDGASDTGRGARLREIEHMPFALYSDLEYERARDVLAAIKRRVRVRLGRRLRAAATGRIDFRRTIRAAIQRGGAFADLRFRSRRPRHIELVILADISGSVKYASTLMLEIAAGARGFFHRFHCFVYIDRLAEADFERGHLVMTPALDLYARSDFGRVLAELLRDRAALLNRAAVVVIMGDGRNNRRPARADLLREAARRCRAMVWLNPEPVSRWRTGDSAIAHYERELDALARCDNLHELEIALKLLQ
jgi:uncharacterized protein with von Willebrand factor type A (vWA) domain